MNLGRYYKSLSFFRNWELFLYIVQYSKNITGMSVNLYSKMVEIARKQGNIQLQQIKSTRQSSQQSQYQAPDEFTLQANQLKQKIEAIKMNNKVILGYKDKISSQTNPAKQQNLRNMLQNLCDQNYEEIRTIKNDLEVIGAAVKKAIQSQPDQPQTRSKILRRQALAKQIQNIVKDTNKICKIIEKYAINTSLKRIMYLAPELQQDEARAIAKKKNGFEQILMSKTLGQASLKLKYRVEDILQKHEDIKKLQKTVEENAQLMNQISDLVKLQGQMIDTVFDNILEAKDYVQKAEKVLVDEKKNVKKGRKKMCCIILIGIIVLAIVLTPIIIKVTKK